jgi:hypothetical protein
MVTMPQCRSSLLCLVGVGVVMISACSGTTRTPSPTPSPTASPAPSPTATPLPPDRLTVAVLAAGVGTFDLAAIPVADLQNDAGFHGAASVVAHFTTHRSGRTLGSLDAVPVNLGPGERLAVTADCTDACDGATSVSVTVTVGAWPTSIGAVFATASAGYACQPCRPGHGFGDVKRTLTPSPAITAGSAVVAFATCRDRSGAILGGGSRELVWPGGASLSVVVPVVVNAPPSSCALAASTGW